MRMPMIAGNWKMNTTVDTATDLMKSLVPNLDAFKGVEIVLCPPFVSLASGKLIVKGSTVKLGAQNMFYEKSGAYTGEISPLMLAELCEYVIIGHSERRQIFGETDEIVNKKVMAAVLHLLKPIMCVGETLEENEAGETEKVLTRQLTACSNRDYFSGGMVIAYEPIWAIGTGKSATSDEAEKTIGFIRNLVRKEHGDDIADNVRILYGGSVTAENIAGLMSKREIDGALVGGASLKIDDFTKIVQQTSEVRGIS